MQKSALIITLALVATRAFASNTQTAPSKEKEKSAFDRMWEAATFYKNEDAAFLKEIRFVGRLHADVFSTDSSLGAEQDWVIRRVRGGIKAKLTDKLGLHVEADFTPQDATPLYNRLTEANLTYKFNDALKISVGKLGAKFTLDGHGSSNEIITSERSNLSNNLSFTVRYTSGISLSGKFCEGWQYYTGIFSGGTNSPEFGNFDAGRFAIFSLGYDFANQLQAKEALLRMDYVYNQRDPESDATRSFENIGSINFALDYGKWGFSADVTGGTGYGRQPNAWGIYVMPWVKVTDRIQLVARYTYIDSDGPDGVRFARYESVSTSGRGDNYQEVYAGVNYYIYGHKLKLQTGLNYAIMKDSAGNGGEYEGWTWTTGLRLSW